MQKVDYANFDFGQRLRDYVSDVMNYGGTPRTESDLTEGQKVFLRAVKREMVKYADPNRQGYPHNLLEQMESFTRTIGDLHNSYFDAGMRKVATACITAGKCSTTKPRSWPQPEAIPDPPGSMSSRPSSPTCRPSSTPEPLI